jgi:hypothetical protein
LPVTGALCWPRATPATAIERAATPPLSWPWLGIWLTAAAAYGAGTPPLPLLLVAATRGLRSGGIAALYPIQGSRKRSPGACGTRPVPAPRAAAARCGPLLLRKHVLNLLVDPPDRADGVLARFRRNQRRGSQAWRYTLGVAGSDLQRRDDRTDRAHTDTGGGTGVGARRVPPPRSPTRDRRGVRGAGRARRHPGAHWSSRHPKFHLVEPSRRPAWGAAQEAPQLVILGVRLSLAEQRADAGMRPRRDRRSAR